MINIMYNFQSMIERDYFEGLVTQHLILLVYHVNSWKNNYSLCIKWCLVLELALWACCSVSQSCLTLCDPMDYRTTSHQASLSFTISWSLLKLTSIQLVIPSNHLILCCPLLLLPSIFPSIRVFSSELAVRIRWPKYWSFSFSTSPSNEYSGSISFRIDWFDLLAVQGL